MDNILDGERVNSSCSQHQDGESSHRDGESSPPEEAVSKTEDEQNTSPSKDDVGRREESLIQQSSDAQEDDATRSSEGYSIVEGALIGGFWIFWLSCGFWGT